MARMNEEASGLSWYNAVSRILDTYRDDGGALQESRRYGLGDGLACTALFSLHEESWPLLFLSIIILPVFNFIQLSLPFVSTSTWPTKFSQCMWEPVQMSRLMR